MNPKFLKELLENLQGIIDLMDPAREAQALQRSFEAMKGVEDAARLVEEIQVMSENSVYAQKDLAKQAVKLGKADFGKNIIPDLDMLQTLSLGNTEKLDAFTTALTDIHKEGNLSVQTLLALEANGFYPLYQMSKDTGESMDSLKKRLLNGQISFNELHTSMQNATEMGSRFGRAMEHINDSGGGQFAIMNNELESVRLKFGQILIPIYDLLDQLFGQLLNQVVKPVVDDLLEMATWLEENRQVTYALALGVGVAAATFGLWTFYMNAAAITAWLVEGATGALSGAMAVLNFVMNLNPIVRIAGLLLGLVAAMLYAWENVEGFRQAVWGLWEVFKQAFTNIGNFFKMIFDPILEAITAFQEGRFGDAALALGKGILNLNPVGMVVNEIMYAAEGGFTAGFGEAMERGKVLGKLPEKQTDPEKSAATPSGITENDIMANAKNKGKVTATETRSQSIASGGPRVININGVKFTDRIEVHNASTQDNANEIQRIFEDMFLRVLNSSALVQ